MEFKKAWEILGRALDTGVMSAHGAGLINRHEVGLINEAQEAVGRHIDELAKANSGFVEHFNKQHEDAAEAAAEKGEDCGCDETE